MEHRINFSITSFFLTSNPNQMILYCSREYLASSQYRKECRTIGTTKGPHRHNFIWSKIQRLLSITLSGTPTRITPSSPSSLLFPPITTTFHPPPQPFPFSFPFLSSKTNKQSNQIDQSINLHLPITLNTPINHPPNSPNISTSSQSKLRSNNISILSLPRSDTDNPLPARCFRFDVLPYGFDVVAGGAGDGFGVCGGGFGGGYGGEEGDGG